MVLILAQEQDVLAHRPLARPLNMTGGLEGFHDRDDAPVKKRKLKGTLVRHVHAMKRSYEIHTTGRKQLNPDCYV